MGVAVWSNLLIINEYLSLVIVRIKMKLVQVGFTKGNNLSMYFTDSCIHSKLVQNALRYFVAFCRFHGSPPFLASCSSDDHHLLCFMRQRPVVAARRRHCSDAVREC